MGPVACYSSEKQSWHYLCFLFLKSWSSLRWYERKHWPPLLQKMQCRNIQKGSWKTDGYPRDFTSGLLQCSRLFLLWQFVKRFRELKFRWEQWKGTGLSKCLAVPLMSPKWGCKCTFFWIQRASPLEERRKRSLPYSQTHTLCTVRVSVLTE